MNQSPLIQGRTVLVEVITQVPGTLSGSLLDRPLNFVADGNTHWALTGVLATQAPGLVPLTLNFDDGQGGVATFTQYVAVDSANYPLEQIAVASDVAAILNNSDTVQGELAYVESQMTGFTTDRLWDGPFLLPTLGVLTSGFGAVRSYNNGLFSAIHTGADFASRASPPVLAPAAGIVVDTGLLDVRGFVVILDHGRGVYTGYWHMSAILVEPGDTVAAGQQLGVMGNTGLSTAAHLHWEMRVNGVQVDPLQWVREDFP
ncbi:MAG: M23 family metallopeptidase [Chloroflexi bacterium]|nr:M23 family metallopeptidase [Chloroflexota bacterium]